jgi:hypothetical protein
MNGIATHRLLCFETGDGAPLPEPEEEAGLVFASSAIGTGDLGSWPQAGGADGLAAGDAICRTLARDAGLPDPDGFVAWLSTSTADAIDRLGGFPGPWKRVDGAVAVRLGPAGPEMETTLNVAERRQVTGYWAWTGTDNDGGWAGAGEDCGGWTVATGPPPSGAWGWMTDLVYWSNNDNSVDCSATLHLYCFGTAMVLFLDGFEIGSAVRWSAAVP